MITLLRGDAREVLRTLDAGSIHCVVTSPPYYGLRSYLPAEYPDKAKEMGSERTPEAYVAEMVDVFREARRVLRDDGVCFVNLGDSYATGPSGAIKSSGLQGGQSGQAAFREASSNKSVPVGLKPKDLIGIPWRFALAMQADGWWLRSAMPWIKRSVMPESTEDRPGSAVEYVFMFTKSERYFWDHVAVQRKGAIPAGTRAAKGSDVRSELKDVNGRPPEYWEYTGTRNFRNSDLFFSALEEAYGLITDADGTPVALDVNPEPLKDAHFAAYPSKLVHPLILGATSEKGCCAGCGLAWRRVIEKRDTGRRQKAADGWDTGSGAHGTIHRSGRQKGATGVPVMASVTIAWHLSCDCGAATAPCRVLDPFGGSGTTGIVADRLGRDAILIDLNLRYIKMARDRLRDDAGMFVSIAG